MIEFEAAITAVRAAYDGAKLALAARDQSKVREAVADMSLHLASASLALTELSSRTRQLEQECSQLREQARMRSSYVLHEVASGRFVYRYIGEKSPEVVASPSHYLCQNCFDKGIKSVFRQFGQREWLPPCLVCAEDKAHEITLDFAAS